jgi:formylglycine-generating enzyme required for sulfatase activity
MTNSLSTFHPDALERGELVDAVTGNMVWIPGGTFRMGSDRHYVEEAPAHRVTVDAFWIDRFPVTNDDFRRFVDDTGHVTYAELEPNAADYPGALPEMLYAGSLVFTKPPIRVDLGNSHQWWSYVRGAQYTDWYRPRHTKDRVKACCIPHNPRGGSEDASRDPRDAARMPRKVLKGGSHLCAPNYCRRYRPAARFPEPIDTSACHVGFRCVVRVPKA